ncbi:MAG: DUF1353 domain-containing protein [Gammaproteobacteria bacterium]
MLRKEEPFSGTPETKWLSDDKKPDREMQLLQDFQYTDPDNKNWSAKAGDIIDGASIPRFLWTLVGSPYTRDYRRASIVHDIAVRGLGNTHERKLVDKMFYHACRDGGCSVFESWMLYLGVRIGSWLSEEDKVNYDEFECLSRDPGKLDNISKGMKAKFNEMVEKLRLYVDETSFDVIDREIDKMRDELVESGTLRAR